MAPVADASAVVRTFPGCGATLAACMTAAPHGATIRLRTNNLIPLPDALTLPKALKLEPAKGFHPKIGRTGLPVVLLNFSVTQMTGGVSIRGITLRQVAVQAIYSQGRHATTFVGNTVRLNSGFNGDDALSLSYSTVSFGPIVITGNDVVASGSGLDIFARGGTATITGNTITSPRVGDSQTALLFVAQGTVKAIIANNVIHHVADCDCGLSNGMTVSTSDQATLNAWVVNNTVSNIGNSPSGIFRGILIRSPSMGTGTANVRVYNNAVANVNVGIDLEAGAGLQTSGAKNNVFATTMPASLNGRSIGTILHKNPRFVNANGPNYRLKASSPLANHAESCIPGLALPRSDAGRRFRYFGAGLDIGAYERGSTTLGTAKGVSKTGTNKRNRLKGGKGRDVLCGLGGNDTLLGFGGNDFLFGGLGADKAFGGDGNDRIDLRDGKQGNDAGDGGPGQDVCMRDARDRRTSC